MAIALLSCVSGGFRLPRHRYDTAERTPQCKECGVGVLRLLGVFRMFRWLNRNRLTILTYHSVLPSTSGIDDGEARNVVDAETFAWQMQYLAKHFCCLRLEEAVELLRSESAASAVFGGRDV